MELLAVVVVVIVELFFVVVVAVVVVGGRDLTAAVLLMTAIFFSLLLACTAMRRPSLASYQSIRLQCSLHLQPGSISWLGKRGESKKDQPLSLPGTNFSFELSRFHNNKPKKYISYKLI